MTTVSITVERGGHEIDVEVDFQYHRAERTRLSPARQPEGPDEPAEMEFISAWSKRFPSVSVELTEEEIASAEEKAWSELND
jgi:hypothetical protein